MATRKGFICYARDDHEMVRTLRTYVASVEADFDIEFWQDTELRGGHAWAESIEQAIARADVFSADAQSRLSRE